MLFGSYEGWLYLATTLPNTSSIFLRVSPALSWLFKTCLTSSVGKQLPKQAVMKGVLISRITNALTQPPLTPTQETSLALTVVTLHKLTASGLCWICSDKSGNLPQRMSCSNSPMPHYPRNPWRRPN